MARDPEEAAPGAAFFSSGDAAAPQSFSSRVRQHTASLHREAERTGFVRAMLTGRISFVAYRVWLRNLHVVYGALEQALNSPEVDAHAVCFREALLFRSAALAADLDALEPTDWRSLPPLTEADAYAGRIIAARSSARLAGHAYTRYLGDLSGGQLLASLVAKHLGLPGTALRYYAFPGISDVPAFRTHLRERLDAALCSETAAQEALLGAAEGFELSIALSRAVAVSAD